LIEAIVWSTELKQNEDLIKKGNQIAMKCIKENESQVKCESIKSYNKWLQYAERKLNKE
jgi:DNA polymerase-3 subunit alpha